MYVEPRLDDYLDVMTAKFNKPIAGDIVISPEGIMQTPAGWYVGQVCAEYDDNYGWMYMPFDRLSGYFATKIEAQNHLEQMKLWEE